MSKGRTVVLVLEGIGGLFLAVVLFGAFEIMFGSIGFVFAMLAILGLFAVLVLVSSLRKRKVSPSGAS